LKYLDKLETVPADNADNALYLGTAMHLCLQESIKAGIDNYYSNYNIIDDTIISEAVKLELIARKARAIVPADGIAEYEIDDDDYKGFIDWLVPVSDTEYDLYDFKYCSANSASKYSESDQLHLYKYYFEKHSDKKIKNLFFVIIPKTGIRLKKDETLDEFRLRIKSECEKIEPYLLQVEYRPEKVIEFLTCAKRCIECTDFVKNEGNLCRWCEYELFCKNGDLSMLLPKNERRDTTGATNRKLWIYGAPFSGKTTFANQFPDPLMLNTDGNINFVDAPYISIKDEVTVEGRITNRKLAWDVFKEAIAELEKKQNDFKTIVIDLIEDTYEYCRLYMYDKMGISHESDSSFKAWDMVRTEFLSTIKRLMNLNYENIILISHEDSSRDLTKKTGDKISAIKPNIQDKLANKLAGMVDIVARAVAEDNDRVLSFKSSEVVFGGGRLTVKANEIPLTYEAYKAVYNTVPKAEPVKTEEPKPEEPKVEEPKWYPQDETPKQEQAEPTPAPRARRRRATTE
jgi:phage nucleotide-binding protein